MNKDELTLFDRPIAFQRCFVRLTHSVNAALMLSQAVYWSIRTKNPDGWFWKTQDEWEEETGLTRREQESARKQLRSIGFWDEELRGVPAKLYFHVDKETLQSSLADYAILVCTKAPNKNGGLRQTLLPETTSEITSETTTPFEAFWDIYPRKVGRKLAKIVWWKLTEEEKTSAIKGLRLWKQAEQWQREDGKYVPYASTFLQQRRWEDEPWTGAFDE